LYYQNWHITLTKSHNKTASATAGAASHQELCRITMATAIKPVKKNKNKNQHFLCVPWLPTPQATFFFIGEILQVVGNFSDWYMLVAHFAR